MRTATPAIDRLRLIGKYVTVLLGFPRVIVPPLTCGLWLTADRGAQSDNTKMSRLAVRNIKLLYTTNHKGRNRARARPE